MKTACLALLMLLPACSLLAADRPNVIIVMSDDQGVGDYGFQGNSLIRTPALDALHSQSGFLSNFYVSPVCAPTRACLMTGRYNYRTRCIDTYIGRAMMDTEEVTLAEFLRDAGYRTGIYGKWHMGDNYPLRAMDQGFQDSVVHRGGGIGQPSDPVGAEGKYTDPTLFENGVQQERQGYCTDIYFDEAMEFIEESSSSGQPFFTYIATNAPHGPFHDVPPGLLEEYSQVDFAPIMIGKLRGERLAKENDKLARIAAMITNIDENVGRLVNKLDALKIRDNTILIYLNDNGPNSMRYVGNMRGMKATVDNGGIRSPLIFHWPKRVAAKQSSAEFSAHIDLLPTILDACGVSVPPDHKLDGRSFLPLLTGSSKTLPKRTVVFQTHRGNQPQRYHHVAVHEEPWKLVHPSGFGSESFDGKAKFELYNLATDPMQENDVVAQHEDVAQRLIAAYDAWFDDVSSTRPDNYAPPRIVIGTVHEPESVLTRQDWRHSAGRPWAGNSNGAWLLEAPEAATYRVHLLFNEDNKTGKANISIGEQSVSVDVDTSKPDSNHATIQLPAGKLTLAVDVTLDGQLQGPHQVVLSRQQ